jgi:hypothetical protein
MFTLAGLFNAFLQGYSPLSIRLGRQLNPCGVRIRFLSRFVPGIGVCIFMSGRGAFVLVCLASDTPSIFCPSQMAFSLMHGTVLFHF